MTPPLETEKRFLVLKNPPPLEMGRGQTIQVGFLSTCGSREVALTKTGASRNLLIREGRGRLRNTKIHPLREPDFDALWSMTEGHRLTKVVHKTTCHGRVFTIETYGGPFAPLRIASVRLPSSGAVDFEKPEWVGAEVTLVEEYRDAHLAMHGPPPPRNGRSQAGALPFLFRDGVLHIVLVTSSSGLRWIIPKGTLEPRMTRQEVAIMEAAEEAGAIGVIEPGCETKCLLQDGRTLHLYPLRVTTLLPLWPERALRRRVVLPVYRALLRIRDTNLERCIREMGRRLAP